MNSTRGAVRLRFCAILCAAAVGVSSPRIAWAHAGVIETARPGSGGPFAPEVLIGVAIATVFYVTGWLRRRDVRRLCRPGAT